MVGAAKRDRELVADPAAERARLAKSRAEMMKLVGKLLAEYAEFQRRRPGLPQGDLRDLSERN
jgi:hypothetical protein